MKKASTWREGLVLPSGGSQYSSPNDHGNKDINGKNEDLWEEYGDNYKFIKENHKDEDNHLSEINNIYLIKNFFNDKMLRLRNLNQKL